MLETDLERDKQKQRRITGRDYCILPLFEKGASPRWETVQMQAFRKRHITQGRDRGETGESFRRESSDSLASHGKKVLDVKLAIVKERERERDNHS